MYQRDLFRYTCNSAKITTVRTDREASSCAHRQETEESEKKSKHFWVRSTCIWMRFSWLRPQTIWLEKPVNETSISSLWRQCQKNEHTSCCFKLKTHESAGRSESFLQQRQRFGKGIGLRLASKNHRSIVLFNWHLVPCCGRQLCFGKKKKCKELKSDEQQNPWRGKPVFGNGLKKIANLTKFYFGPMSGDPNYCTKWD